MNAIEQQRRASPAAPAKPGGTVRLSAALTIWTAVVFPGALLLAGSQKLQAQETLCRFGHIQERVSPAYPSILNGRIVEGAVTLLGTVTPDGRIASSKPLSGPSALRFEAQAYLNGWRVDPSEQQRQCTFSFDYRFDGSQAMCTKRTQTTLEAERLDDTHVIFHLHCDL